MESWITQVLGSASGAGAYSLVFLVLLLCGLGVPLPEDVALITGGYLVYNEAARLGEMMVVGFVGILGGDTIVFMMGRHLGEHLTRRWPFKNLVTPEKHARVERLFARYGQKIVMLARFMPGVRAPTFFGAGHAGMRYPTFIFFDGLAALVSAPVFVFLGFHFGSDIQSLIAKVRSGQRAVLVVLAGVAALWLGGRWFLKRRRAQREAREASRIAPGGEPFGSAAPGAVSGARPGGE